MKPTRLRIVRRAAGLLWIGLLRSTGCLRFVKWRLRSKGAVLVLMCHRVLADPAFLETHSPADIIVREGSFRDLIRYIRSECHVVPLHDAMPGRVGNKLQIILTFDDGWSDNYTQVFPIVCAQRLPITIFVCSGVMAQDLPFWPERVAMLLKKADPTLSTEAIKAEIESLKSASPAHCEEYLGHLAAGSHTNTDNLRSVVDSTLSWDQALEMLSAGVEFGSHTHTHQILTHLPLPNVRAETQTSKALIEQALSQPCDCFTYPNGNWSQPVRDAVAESGYKYAFTTEAGAWNSNNDPLAIPRLNVSEENIVGWNKRFSPAVFDYHMFWKAWRASRRRIPLVQRALAGLRLQFNRRVRVQGNVS
jgi:peptidoglycan/xylan/chitin deacetylase (PgdA/CDA1 family)